MESSIRPVATAFAILVWAALVLNLALGVAYAPADHLSLAEVVEGFFSSFTILSTLFAAIALMAIALDKTALRHATALTAIAVYLCIVTLVYLAEFHGALETTGARRIPDALIHIVIPVAFTVFWFITVPKGVLTWCTPFALLAFPLVYLAYMLTRGALTGVYAYPFLDVHMLGASRVAVYATGLLGVYLVVGTLYTLVNYLLGCFVRPLPASAA